MSDRKAEQPGELSESEAEQVVGGRAPLPGTKPVGTRPSKGGDPEDGGD